jgi:hypothetical protein
LSRTIIQEGIALQPSHHPNKNSATQKEEPTSNIVSNVASELSILVGIIIALVVVFQVIYNKESLLVVARTIAGFSWLFILPGYFLLLRFKSRMPFIERIIIGVVVAMGLLGVVSYFSGIFGLHLKYHGILFPAVFIIAGFIFANGKNCLDYAKKILRTNK